MAPSGPAGRRAAVKEHLDELYDFALTVTWDPSAAAAAVSAAVAGLGEREADRAVLLALTRREALVRARPADPVSVDPATDPAPVDPDPGELEQLALGVLHGLAPADRAVLDLALRRGLEPHDIAAALDTPAEAVSATVAEVRARADHLLGHYVLARIGTRYCTALASTVDEAASGLVALAERVDAHLPACEECSARREALAPATSFLPSIPERPAPAGLRESLVRRASVVRRLTHGRHPHEASRWRRAVGIAALIGVVGAALGVGALVVRDESSDDPAIAAEPVAVLAGSPRSVDFGADDETASVTLRNTSEEPVAWTAAVDVPWLSVEPSEGRVEPGSGVELALALDRAAAPEGEIVTTARFEGAQAAVEVEIQAVVAKPPTIEELAIDPTSVSVAPCEGGVTTATVAATVRDGGGLASVVARWTAPDGTTGEAAMTAEGDRWRATIGPYETAGEASWTVVATDTGGESSEAEGPALTVEPECVVPDDEPT